MAQPIPNPTTPGSGLASLLAPNGLAATPVNQMLTNPFAQQFLKQEDDATHLQRKLALNDPRLQQGQ